MTDSITQPKASPSLTNIKAFKLTGDLNDDMDNLKQRKTDAEETAIAEWVKKQYQKCKSQLEPIKRQWYMNLAFHKGDHYVDFVHGRLIKIPAPSSKVRLVINRIKPVVRTEVSRMTSKEATVEVVPASNEDVDTLSAEAAQAVFESLRTRLELQKVLRKAAWWCSVTGIGYIKTYWDKSYESEDSNEQVIIGDHCYSAVSPFNLLVPDLLEEEIEDQPYLLNVFTKPVDWVKMNYPEVTNRPNFEPSVVSANEIMETQYLNTKSSQAQTAAPDSCLVIEAWVKPGATPLLPKGGRCLVIDDCIVDSDYDGLPYDHGQYPFSKMEAVQSGVFYPTSVIEDLIPIQREINRTRSQLVEARNLMAKPGFFYRTGSLDPNKYTSNMAQLIDIKPGQEYPQPIPLPQMPAYVENLGEGFLRDMEDVSGQHQVSKGSAPPGVTAGTAISFLQEADNSYMATTHASLEDCIKKVAKQSIMLAVQYWDSSRMVSYVGKDGIISSKYLEGADLKNGTDIRVEGGSSLPESKAARIALFMDLMTRGALPVEDALKMMELPSLKAYWDTVEVDKKQAIRENIAMSELPPDQTESARAMVSQMVMANIPPGIDPSQNPMASQQMELANQPAVEVHQWDNHDVHILIHTRFMKGQEYEMLPDPIKNEFELHLQQHKDMQMQSAMQQQFMHPEGGPEQQGQPQGSNQFSPPGGGQPPVDAQNPPQ